jgi:Ferredoxin-like domain in Api92-like protein
MTNHVGSTLTVSGSARELARFRASCFSPNPDCTGEVRLDFERITPSHPALLAIEALSDQDRRAAELLLCRAGINVSEESVGPRFSSVDQLKLMTRENLRDILLSQRRDNLNPSCVEAALLILEFVSATGCYNPAGWAMKNWGARGNVIYTEVVENWAEELEVRFDTEWSAPRPIFRTLGLMFPELEFQTASLDPDGDWALGGSIRGSDSKFWNADFASVYELVYGEPMDEADEDEE